MRTFFCLGFIFTATSSLAFIDPQILIQNQTAYYGTSFTKGSVTKNDLSKLLAQKHLTVGYTSARKILFGELHLKTDRQGTYVEDVYCDKKFYFRNVSDVSNMGTQVNIEHTWPQSRFTGKFDKETQKSDLHHLYPTDSAANNKRGNFSFGAVGEDDNRLGLNDCGISRLGNPQGRTVFFPPQEHRGNVARSLFYFATRYQLAIPQDEETTLREWHKADPVDEVERERHEAVVKHQLVRNPFIDYPELVGRISDF